MKQRRLDHKFQLVELRMAAQTLLRRILFFIGFVSLTVDAGPITPAIANDWTIVPGKRVGPITRNTSEMELRGLFSDTNVRREDINVSDAGMEPGTVIFPEDPNKRLEIVWVNSERRDEPREILISGVKSAWKTDRGVSLGTTLKEIEKVNGRPFILLGFGWDYGGTIVDCNQGRYKEFGCANPEDFKRRPKGRTLVLRLNPDDKLLETKDYKSVKGDREFSSGHPSMQRINPRVRWITVLLAAQDIDISEAK